MTHVMNMSQSNKDFVTPDLCLANALSLAFPLLSTYKEGARTSFCFENTPQLQQYLNDYWSDDISVEPKRFFNQLKLLKGYIYGGGNG